MALTADTQWRLRPSGTGIGGFDPSFGDGTDTTDQNAPVVNVSDGVTNGTTALTSATANFLSGYKRSIVQVSGIGYRRIDTVVSATEVTLDATCSAGTGRTIKVGGAPSTPNLLCTTCAAGAPSLTSPLAPGHTVRIQGTSGSSLDSLPSAVTYTWSTGYQFPAGDDTTGKIRFIVYNPIGGLDTGVDTALARIDITDGLIAESEGHIFRGLHLKWAASGPSSVFALSQKAASGVKHSDLYDIVVDQNGAAAGGLFNFPNCYGIYGINSEGFSTAAAVRRAFYEAESQSSGAPVGRGIVGFSVDNWKCGNGASACVINHVNGYGIERGIFSRITGGCIDQGTGTASILDVTIASATGDGIYLWHDLTSMKPLIRNLVLANITGEALKYQNPIDDGGEVMRFILQPDYIAYYNNGTNRSAHVPAGAHDVSCSVDPFLNATAGDFRPNTAATGGALIRNMGWPSTYLRSAV